MRVDDLEIIDLNVDDEEEFQEEKFREEKFQEENFYEEKFRERNFREEEFYEEEFYDDDEVELREFLVSGLDHIYETKKDNEKYNKKQNKHAKGYYEDEDDDEVDWVQEIKSIVTTVLVTLVIVFLLKSFVIINACVPTGSMENTIMPGDNILGLRIAYLVEEPERGDVIFFYFPDDETQKYVKRIIGLPGEKVYINEGKIYINDSETPLEEPYLKEEWIVSTGPYEFYVPEDCYLMLGDNRNDSADARLWKNQYVAKEKIIGKAIFTYYPFDRWGFVE